MLDRVGEQFHQFIAPRSSLPLHPSLPPLFDAYISPSHQHLPLHQQQPPANLLSPLHHHKDGEEEEEEEQRGRMMSFEMSEREGGLGEHELKDSTTWTDDEVLALLRIRSDLDTWFPHLTWEHVSRKLAELGFKRSAEKCKEKFEEETSYFNNIHYTKNRFMSELEQLYQQQQQQQQEEEEEEAHQMPGGVVGEVEVEAGVDAGCEESNKQAADQQHVVKMDHGALQHGDDASVTKKCEETTLVKRRRRRRGRGKRKREEDDKLEILKGFCEKMVKRMMEKQEEMHKKLLEDMVRRDEEIMERQEAWKKEEMEGMNWELELMAKEQAVAAQRQAAIIELLKKISEQSRSVSSDDPDPNCAPSNSSWRNPNPSNNSKYTTADDDDDDDKQADGGGGSSEVLVGNINPSCSSDHHDCGVKEEVGRRWPREEVMALIKLRSSSSSANEEREGGGGRIPLWERISEGMRGMGYSRSAKRCKEKWENINKYFRKTKHLSKNRSLDSRTCPYFPQLTSLYSQ